MSPNLFRTEIVSRDPRYPLIITICNYSLAALFLGMFLTLSGVMLSTYDQNSGVSADQRTHHRLHGQSSLNHKMQYDHINQQDGKSNFAKIFGVTLLVMGCLLIAIAIGTFFMASFMYMKTKTTPPADTGELEGRMENVWEYLDEMPDRTIVSKTETTGNQQEAPKDLPPEK